MPNTLSAKKRLRQNFTHRARNRSTKAMVRSLCRKVREATERGEIEAADATFREACKQLDRAGARRILHPNAVSRTKSRLSAQIKAAKQSAEAES